MKALSTVLLAAAMVFGFQTVQATSYDYDANSSVTLDGESFSYQGKSGTRKFGGAISVYDAGYYKAENGTQMVRIYGRTTVSEKKFTDTLNGNELLSDYADENADLVAASGELTNKKIVDVVLAEGVNVYVGEELKGETVGGADYAKALFKALNKLARMGVEDAE